MRVYSINTYRVNKPTLVYIVKAENSKVARDFLVDHLKNVDCRVGEFVFFLRSCEVTLFDSYDPQILEILSYDLYNKKY